MTESAPSSYPAPKTQELSLLAKKIQQSDNAYVLVEIRKNPRLLSASTDAPTILQEGFRYNALHVAARWGNSQAAQIILSTVNGTSYMKSLYPDDPKPIREDRTKFLTDMYLNTPDKGALETPLHFACKFGFYDVAKLLLGHPLCDTSLMNRDMQTAKQVIGSRATGSNAANNERLEKLFLETQIVPIWRDLTHDSPPVVGRPVNFKYLGSHTPKTFTFKYGDVTLNHFGPVDTSCIPKSRLGTDWEIRAYAGPTDEQTAARFYETMKGTSTVTYATQDQDQFSLNGSPDLRTLYNDRSHAPNRPIPTTSTSFLRKSIHVTPTRASTLAPTFTTPERKSTGDSRNFTPGLKTPKDPLSSTLLSPLEFRYTPETLSLLLTSPVGFNTPTRNGTVEDRQVRRRDPWKGVERVARKYTGELGIPWKEYWNFLGEFVDLSSETGLVFLEDHLYRARENQIEEEELLRENLKSLAESTPVSAMCNGMQNLNLGSSGVSVKQEFSPDWRTRLTGIHQQAEPQDPTDNANTPEMNFMRYSIYTKKIHSGGAVSFISVPPEETRKFKLGIRKLFPVEREEMEMDGDSISPKSSPPVTESWMTADANEELAWRTPLSSSASSSESDSEDSAEEFEDCPTYSLYINGPQPSREDVQAMHAVSNVVENLSPTKYPQITAWYNCLKATATNLKK